MNYRPLPEGLEIRKSRIHGKGLFTLIRLPANKDLGITHIKNNSGKFHSDLIRTPLGGFINHSSSPNCKLIKEDGIYNLVTLEEISPWSELTLSYGVADCGKSYDFLNK